MSDPNSMYVNSTDTIIAVQIWHVISNSSMWYGIKDSHIEDIVICCYCSISVVKIKSKIKTPCSVRFFEKLWSSSKYSAVFMLPSDQAWNEAMRFRFVTHLNWIVESQAVSFQTHLSHHKAIVQLTVSSRVALQSIK